MDLTAFESTLGSSPKFGEPKVQYCRGEGGAFHKALQHDKLLSRIFELWRRSMAAAVHCGWGSVRESAGGPGCLEQAAKPGVTAKLATAGTFTKLPRLDLPSITFPFTSKLNHAVVPPTASDILRTSLTKFDPKLSNSVPPHPPGKIPISPSVWVPPQGRSIESTTRPQQTWRKTATYRRPLRRARGRPSMGSPTMRPRTRMGSRLPTARRTMASRTVCLPRRPPRHPTTPPVD